ncbi:MAG: hypothetical protein ACLPIC_04690 [Rhodoblastus sp.]|uniref:hypothetical protein n=1 Tax=Rhodoblastus sp. TaxID=1962975 RepID=UPI003F9A2663
MKNLRWARTQRIGVERRQYLDLAQSRQEEKRLAESQHRSLAGGAIFERIMNVPAKV